jgi:hypothetical protein
VALAAYSPLPRQPGQNCPNQRRGHDGVEPHGDPSEDAFDRLSAGRRLVRAITTAIDQASRLRGAIGQPTIAWTDPEKNGRGVAAEGAGPRNRAWTPPLEAAMAISSNPRKPT